MLTPMTFALAAGHAAPAFNGLFYATAAAIIPVLFIALAVQVPVVDDLIEATETAIRAFRKRMPDLTAQGQISAGRALAGSFIVSLPGLAAAVIIFLGTLAEILAVVVLYRQRADSTTGFYVILGTIVLILAVAWRPFMMLVRAMVRQVREDAIASRGPSKRDGPAWHELTAQGDAAQHEDITDVD
jgi:hypothetical protein